MAGPRIKRVANGAALTAADVGGLAGFSHGFLRESAALAMGAPAFLS
jgi:hypothetical protein